MKVRTDMKILINTPSLSLLGGVANHYWGLKNYWTEDVRYNIVGKRDTTRNGAGKYWLPYDIIKFIVTILVFNPSVVVLNPSIARNALKRDFIFLKLSCLLKKNVVFFFHGFNLDNYKQIEKEAFVKMLNKSSGVIVLANKFKNTLKEDGVSVPIEILTTKVDDRMVEKFDITKRIGTIKNILFLARIEKEKGVYEALDTFSILKRKHSDLCLTIVGSGSVLNDVKNYAFENKIKDVRFTGALSGENLINAFLDADCYLFPSSYGEGMPTSVLEAMAFGLPVFTRKVGGLTDFFEDGKMGFITESLNPQIFADEIEKFIKDEELTKNVSMYNYSYAKKHFYASIVAVNTQNAIKRMLNIS